MLMTEEPKRIAGAVFVCEVPKEMGRVTKLEKKRGKIIARTENGGIMIIPTNRTECP